jgi:predicted site-specific integrase-resolvase
VRDLDAWVTPAEAAEELPPEAGVTDGTVREWARRGLLRPVWREGRSARYVLADVFAVEARTRGRGRPRQSGGRLVA